jgi:hypothetical protein
MRRSGKERRRGIAALFRGGETQPQRMQRRTNSKGLRGRATRDQPSGRSARRCGTPRRPTRFGSLRARGLRPRWDFVQRPPRRRTRTTRTRPGRRLPDGPQRALGRPAERRGCSMEKAMIPVLKNHAEDAEDHPDVRARDLSDYAGRAIRDRLLQVAHSGGSCERRGGDRTDVLGDPRGRRGLGELAGRAHGERCTRVAGRGLIQA